MPEAEVNFALTETDLTQVKKAAALMQLPDISITSNKGEIILSALDKKNDTANIYSVKIGKTNET